MERPLFACFVALVALSPLPFGGAPRLAEAGLGLAAGLLALAFAVAAQRAPQRIGPDAGRTWWLAAGFALFAAWGAAQILPIWPAGLANPAWPADATGLPLTADGSAAGDVLLRLIGAAAVFWMALHLGRDSGRARVLLVCLVAAGTAYALYGLAMQLSGLKLVLWWERRFYPESVTGTFVNRNHFATYAGMLAVAATAILLRRIVGIGGRGLNLVSRIRLAMDSLGRTGWLALAAALLMLLAVVLSTSRAGLLATLVGVALAFAGMAARPDARIWPWLAGFAVFLAGGIGLAVFGLGFGDRLIARIGAGGDLMAGRADVTRATLEALAARPATGYGLGSFPGLFESARSLALAEEPRPYLHAHNSYVELAAEAGWPAFALLQALLAGCAWRCWLGIRRRRHDWLYCVVGFAAAGVAGVHALFDFSVQLTGVSFTLAALLGLGVAQSWRQGGRAAESAAA